MKYKETSAINLNGAMPSSTYPTTSSGNYFEFQITGKNTSTKDITYNVKLAYGDEEIGKDRLRDNHLLFKLVEVVNNEEVAVSPEVIDKSFDTIPGATLYTATIPANTTTESTRTFRVYARIDENVGIGTNTTYTTEQWNNLYASIKINVDGGFVTPSVPAGEVVRANIKSNNTSSTCQNATLTYTEDGITYISGSADCIDFNYLWYSGKMWRITAIYPDGAMKLVTENNITSIAFGETSTGGVNFYTDENTKSYMYQWLNEDFYDTLYNASEFIDTSKTWNATMPENTTISTKPGNTNLVTANVGLLNSYEYYNSYRCNGSSACSESTYSSGYLNIGYNWWLLNPYNASGVWLVFSYGLGYGIGPGYTYAARPSINLLSTVKILGTGTKTDPYKIVGDKEVGTTGNDLNTRQVGEYVKLKSGDNEQVFRIVSFENNTTKLIALDYVDGGNTTKAFATANSSGNGTIFGEGNTIDDTDNTTWYSYLKNVYISDLKTKYGSNMFTTGEYYLGIKADNPSNRTEYYNYRTSICAGTSDLSKNCLKSRSKTLEAGLLRYGEMFATQQKWGSQKNKVMWLMTRRKASDVWSVNPDGFADSRGPTNANAARPSINLSSGVKIVTCDTDLCDGTPNHPYVVGL